MLTNPLWQLARRWLYGVSTAALALAVFYGYVDKDAAALWGALIAAIAYLHTPFPPELKPGGGNNQNITPPAPDEGAQ